ncbi:MAG: NADH:ubiquinone oxidoreductase [Pseudomonadota bacterium]
MEKFTKNSDDRAMGAAVVAALWAFVGAGMAAVMWGFDISQTGGTFIVLWIGIFIALSIGWRELPSPPGGKKAPTVDTSHHSVTPAAAEPAAPAAPPAESPTASASAAPAEEAAPSSGTASAAEEAAPIGTKPTGLEGPRDGTADDLKQIKGVGPALEKLCNSLGFYHFDQIAAWTGEEVAWVDEHLEGFKGRVTRDDWVAQAKALVAERSAAQ